MTKNKVKDIQKRLRDIQLRKVFLWCILKHWRKPEHTDIKETMYCGRRRVEHTDVYCDFTIKGRKNCSALSYTPEEQSASSQAVRSFLPDHVLLTSHVHTEELKCWLCYPAGPGPTFPVCQASNHYSCPLQVFLLHYHSTVFSKLSLEGYLAEKLKIQYLNWGEKHDSVLTILKMCADIWNRTRNWI